MATLERKRALLTGAGSGIGRAIAVELARRQVHLCLVDRNSDALAQTADLCRASRIYVTTCSVDLTAAGAIDTICGHARQTLGGLDLLVNNAGVVYYGSFEQMTAAQLTEISTVNLLAPLELTRACLPWLLENTGSYVLNVASMYAYFPTRRAAAYHATKAGLLAFSQALRVEYARYRLEVGCLCPGFANTALFENALMHPGRTLRSPPQWLTTTPEHVARVAIGMILRNRGVQTVTLPAWLAWQTRQWLPALIDWFAHRRRRAVHPLQRSASTTAPSSLSKFSSTLSERSSGAAD